MIGIFETNLIIISSICSFFWFVFLYLTREVKPILAGGTSDNDLMIKSAARSNEWRWPSDMHTKTYTGTATSQKDLTIILLAVFQKLFRDKNGEFPILALWGFTHAASAFLVYLIGSSYWNPNIALLISLLYLSSFWMWQMSLFVGHLNVATMFFLLAVYCLTQAVGASSLITNLLIFASGIYFCCMLFSSSSSLRYAILFFVAVFWTKFQMVGQELSLNGFYKTLSSNHGLLISLIFTLAFAIFIFVIKLYYKKIITAIYERRAWFFNGLISAKKYPLANYIQRAEEQLPNVFKWLIKFYTFLFIIVNIVGLNYVVPVAIGFILVFLILSLPDIKKSFGFYFRYLYISYMQPDRNAQFVRYVKYGYFAKKGIQISLNKRPGGIVWVPRIFLRMAPIHMLIYIFLLILVAILSTVTILPIINFSVFLILIIISLLPILWAELTGAVRISKSYSSGLVGFMILIGSISYVFEYNSYFYPISISLIATSIAWNLWKFFSDVYPSRMSFNKIIKTFDKFNIKEIYTYDTFYNDSFFDNVKKTPSLNNLKINLIKSIADVKNGWILIPPTTHKAGYIRQEESIMQGDFTEDPILNQLLGTKDIEKVASAKFKTILGPGNIWLQEGDVLSYLDLILHDIKEKDRFRGYAWLLNSNALTR